MLERQSVEIIMKTLNSCIYSWIIADILSKLLDDNSQNGLSDETNEYSDFVASSLTILVCDTVCSFGRWFREGL